MQKLLDLAGIRINGNHPWDIQILNDEFYGRVLRQGSLGLGESYMDGWWRVPSLDEFICRILQADLPREIRKDLKTLFLFLRSITFNQQGRTKAYEVGIRHYDIGNDLYCLMLDPYLAYSCGYWLGVDNLNQAQEAKLDLICRKLGLKKSDKVLDIGGGWGSFARYAAEHYGVSVDIVTVSKEQVILGRKLSAGLPIRFILQDYRSIEGEYDHIVSVGMIEHVGYKNYRDYMKVAARCLKDDGLFLLHTIGGNSSVRDNDPWVNKYIFPNSMLPSIAQLAKAMEGLFVVEDWHNFGADYDLTLMAWYENFKQGWPQLQDKYGDRFFRMWEYYLLSCAGSFRARKNQLWQIVLSKKGVAGGYHPVR